MTEAVGQPAAGPQTSPGYRYWLLALIFLMMLSNYIDRSIVNILAQPIKEEFRLSDLQVGLLGGFAFACLYMFLGIPIARLAERHNRVTIITVSIAIWSTMTVLCGLANSYIQLLLARVGVGVGEAGASPPSQSLIADYFPPEQRASALSIHSLGIPLGTLGGAILGGLIAEHYGWRAAFFAVGAPGLLVAILFKLTVAEPPRGALDSAKARAASRGPPPSLVRTAAYLFKKPTFVHFVAGMAVTNFALQGIGIFKAAFFVRQFDVTIGHAGLIVGITNGVAAGLGTLIGGFLSDVIAKRDRRWYAWLPAIGLAVSAPFYAIALLQPTWFTVGAWLIPAGVLTFIFLAPTLATTQNLAEPRMRATAVALMTLFGAAFGLALGPAGAGWLSDIFAGDAYAGPGGLSFAEACPGGLADRGAEAAQQLACRRASATGIQHSMIACSIMFAWASIHFLLGARSIRRDLDVTFGDAENTKTSREDGGRTT